MMGNGEKPSYALDASVARGWEIVVNGLPIEALLDAYTTQAHLQEKRADLEWLTATNRSVGIAYTYGLHPNALAGHPYDGIWKREYMGGGAVIAVYAEEPVTRHIYVGVLWQRRLLHHPTLPVLAVPRGYTQPPADTDLFTRFPKDVGENMHRQTALTELTEEMVTGPLIVEMLEQLGPPVTTNNADVDTAGEGEGVYFYRVKLPWSLLEPESPETFRLKAGVQATQALLEGIVGCQFVPIQHILDLLDDPDNTVAGCSFTEIAIRRLARALHRNGYPIFEENVKEFIEDNEQQESVYEGVISRNHESLVPLLTHKDYAAPSVFTVENLLREARRQKGLPLGLVPPICVLDPDGDLVEHLHATDRASRHATWACYHTVLDTFVEDGMEFGIVGRVVGASFAVLVAEELFASGCQLLLSITSAGQIISMGRPPYVVLIERALRDEGTSYHYLPPSPYSSLHSSLREILSTQWNHMQVPLYTGASWTTDAPFRETEAQIEWCREQGILAVEMEAAALYAFASAKQRDVVCFAHVTNQMGQTEGDFEKGEASGSETALHVISQTAQHWNRWHHQ